MRIAGSGQKADTAVTCPRLSASASLPECRSVRDTAQEETLACLQNVLGWPNLQQTSSSSGPWRPSYVDERTQCPSRACEVQNESRSGLVDAMTTRTVPKVHRTTTAGKSEASSSPEMENPVQTYLYQLPRQGKASLGPRRREKNGEPERGANRKHKVELHV